MKNKKFIRTSAIAGSVSLATILGASGATILTGDTVTGNNTPIPLAHGSNEAGTLNIALAWTSSQKWDSYDDWNGRGETYQMENANAGESFTIAFTADAGFNTTLTSLDIDIWAGGGTFIVDWAITGATSGSLATGQSTASTTGLNAVNFGGITGAGSEEVTLTLTMNAGSTGTGSYLAMDNLSFDQVAVPEPSSSLLAVAGLGAMAMRRRRK